MDNGEDKFQEQVRAIVEAGEIGTDEIGDRALTLPELKELAISMGVTEEGWEGLLKKAAVHLKSADDHLRARNFKEAISEGDLAAGINPYLANCNSILAKAYMMLWIEDKTHPEEFKTKADFHARQELKVDPRDMIAINVLSTIEIKSKVVNDDNKSKKLIYIGAGVGLFLVFIILLMLFWPSGDVEPSDDTQTSNSDNTNNQLIEAEEDVNMKWGLVVSAIEQRNNMMPELFRISEGNSQIDSFELSINSGIGQLETLEGENYTANEQSLNSNIDEVKSLFQSTIQGDAAEKLLVQIEGCENRIAFEKKNYNEAVKKYNILVRENQDKFPDYEVKPYFSE